MSLFHHGLDDALKVKYQMKCDHELLTSWYANIFIVRYRDR